MKFTMLGNYYAHPYHSVRELRRGNEKKIHNSVGKREILSRIPYFSIL